MTEKKPLSQEEIAEMNKKGEKMMLPAQEYASDSREKRVARDKKRLEMGDRESLSKFRENGSDVIEGEVDGHKIRIEFTPPLSRTRFNQTTYAGKVDDVSLEPYQAEKLYDKYYSLAFNRSKEVQEEIEKREKESIEIEAQLANEEVEKNKNKTAAEVDAENYRMKQEEIRRHHEFLRPYAEKIGEERRREQEALKNRQEKLGPALKDLGI